MRMNGRYQALDYAFALHRPTALWPDDNLPLHTLAELPHEGRGGRFTRFRKSVQRSARKAVGSEIARQNMPPLELSRQFQRNVHFKPAPDGRINMLGVICSSDQKAGILLDPLQQRVDPSVLFFARSLFGLFSFDADRVEFVDEKHYLGITGNRSVK